jgi:putative transposase
MPNHFHWLLYTPNYSTGIDCPLNMGIGTLLSSYTKAINKKYERTGSLFQQKTKAVEIDSRNYLLTCFHYIHRNPIEAGLVEKPEQWSYSSYPDYIGVRNGTLIKKKFTLGPLDIGKKTIIEGTQQEITEDKIAKIL